MDKNRIKILLIDDDEDDFLLVKSLLSEVRSAKLHLDWIKTYDEGLEATCANCYDVVLLDYRLGERDGVELIHEANRRGCEASIIMLTGCGGYEVDVEAMRAGCADYLLKSQLGRDSLERSIRYSIERKSTEKALQRAQDQLEFRILERTADLEAANMALQESEDRYRGLVESALDIIYAISTDGKVQAINPAFETITGWPARDWIGKDVRSLVHPDDFRTIRKQFARRTAGRVLPSVELRILSQSGEYRIIECKSSPRIKDGKCAAIIGTARDVTERKLMEVAHREAHDELEARVEQRTAELARTNRALKAEIQARSKVEGTLRLDEMRLESLWELSQMSGASDEEIAGFVLAQQVKITGSKLGALRITREDGPPLTIYSPAEVFEGGGKGVCRSFRSLVEEGFWTEAARTCEPVIINDPRGVGAIEGCPADHLPHRVLSVPGVDGKRIVAIVTMANRETNYDRSSVRQVSLLMDGMWRLIQRQRSDKALRDAEKSLRLMADSLPVLISYIDTNLRYRFVNRAHEPRHGIPADQMLGLRLDEVLDPLDYDAVQPYAEKALAGQEVHFELETSYREGKRYLSVWYVPNLEDTGAVIGFFSLIHDITEIKHNEMEVQRHRDELAHIARVATMGELSSSLAHELGQPLTGILSNAQAARRFIQRDVPDIVEVKSALDDIVDDCQRASSVIQKMRSILKKKDFEKTIIDINALVQATMRLVASDALQRKISVKADLAPDLPYVLADRIQLQQVLINLVLNGFDAIMRSGMHSRWMLIRTSSSSDTVTVDVVDTGPGVDPRHMSCIFDPFFTTKAEGLGMGLSIGRYILEAHEGRLWAVRNPDRGMTFSFCLPARQPAKEQLGPSIGWRRR